MERSDDQDAIIRRIADYEQTSAIMWLVIGIIQIICVFTAFAGIWNVVSAFSRFKRVPQIRARAVTIPDSYESITPLVLIGLVNLFFGAVIGVIFVGFDAYIRDLVLSNRSCFAAGRNSLEINHTISSEDLTTLDRLATLRDKGVLDEAEFQRQKAKLLA